MRRYITYLILVAIFLTAAAPAMAEGGAETAILKVNDLMVQVDGVPYELEVAPRVSDDTTMVPLRFVLEVFGAEVGWDSEAREISVRHNDTEIRLEPGVAKAVVNGEVQTIAGAPVIENGITLVPLRFLVEKLNYQVDFLPGTKEIIIKQLPPPNRPPVAEFELEKDTVDQGETVYFNEKSYDPDGDLIVETKWTGRERAFFAPGEYPVTLAVKDSQGNWSEPFTRIITVTEEVKMDRLTYNLHNPIAGEPLGNISNISVLDLEQVSPAVSMDRLQVMISNSPEVVRDDGILFSDVLSGETRLYYHHINGAGENKKIYPLVINQSDEPVLMVVKRVGIAGPGEAMAVGRAAAYRYLDFNAGSAKFVELQPGQRYILNEDKNSIVKPGEAVHGIFDIDARGDLSFQVISVGAQEQIEDYSQLVILNRDDVHIRGTFPMANRSLSVQLDGQEPVRLVVADGSEDGFLIGQDTNTSLMGNYPRQSNNSGNYGVIYKITMHSKERVGVIFSPRGGVFAGAGKWDGKAFYLPNKGIMKPQTEFALIGILEPGKEKVLEFIPPAGSYLPVNLIFVPF
ncbi:stalk domain-containing protein [Desulfoscipio gibsoniae]|uniref:PDK repeat-containing protein n=1 Tax=Desulfoscipio gibsoniae DSM 7213 TaxID=767817 RepID=R4KW02_9FIRM|nr:stalk domain-containing protein [Desulfoscipio gibsoniae]AGL03801.1 PDK repeat-containing protein [Desulfoscipio gibsoniae DSM 7213]